MLSEVVEVAGVFNESRWQKIKRLKQDVIKLGIQTAQWQMKFSIAESRSINNCEE